MKIVIDTAIANQLGDLGVTLASRGTFDVQRDFRIEGPSVIHSQLHFDRPISFGAFSSSFGGRLRAISVGRYVSIAPGFSCGWDEHPLDRISTSMLTYVPNVHSWWPDSKNKNLPEFKDNLVQSFIDHDCWIGEGVFLKSGVRIGIGSIVGARSVVVKDVEPYSIVGGNPARVIRKRFSDNQAEKLLNSQWWEYDLREFPPNLFAQVDKFLDLLQAGVETRKFVKMNPFVLTPEYFQNEKGV